MKKATILFLVLAGMVLAGGRGFAQSREWKIYVISHTHADIGYTDLIPEVERVWCQGMDQAIAAADKGLKWTLEGALLFDVYRRHRSPEKVAQFVKLIKEGKIEVASLYTNIEQENAGPEELVRSNFYANERLRREYGIQSKTAMLSDITGVTWGLPRALAGAGTRYLLFAPGGYKELLRDSTLPHLSYWKSPDGSKVLMQLRSGRFQQYGSANILLNAARMEQGVADLVKYYEGMGDRYPYDAIMLQLASDNVNPRVQLVTNIQTWNQTHTNPKVIMATPAEFFQYIESKFASKIPEISGDITSAWTDDPGIYGQATGMKRRAAEEVMSAEKFAAIDQMGGTDRPYPAAAIDQLYKNLLIYTDHTYGIDSWQWERAPLVQARGRTYAPVFDFYKESWEDKKEFAYDAARASDALLGDAVEALASKIPTEGRTIAVFNPLSWERTDVVRLLRRELKVSRGNYDIIDNTTGEKVPYQPLTGDRGGAPLYDIIVFVAKNVPALGYKTYKIVPATAPPKFETSVKLEGNVVENEFYRVEVDTQTGGVSSILDKQLNRELVDKKNPEKVNQYLYYSITGDQEPVYQDRQSQNARGRVWARDYKIAVYSPLAARVEAGQNGPAMKSIRSEIVMDQGPAPSEISQEVVLYPGIKRIDFINRIHKKETASKEETYYAFPFDVPDFEINCELPGAVFRPGKDQLSGSFTGFSGIQHWADVSNAEFGVAVATREVPAIEFSEIRTNEWDMEYQPKRSAFFFYLFNNKENTNGAMWQGSESWRLGFFETNFAVTSHKGGWRDGNATQFGWEHNAPLVARYIGVPQTGTLPADKASYSDGLPKNVVLQSLKVAEDGKGYIARFYETEGRATEIAWSGLPMRIRQAQLTNLVEQPLGAARIEGGKVSFSMAPWQMVTIRLLP